MTVIGLALVTATWLELVGASPMFLSVTFAGFPVTATRA